MRYRYYVSQSLLQKCEAKAGSISRVAAPDIEELVVAAVRHHVFGSASTKAGDARRAVVLADAIDGDRPGQGGHDDAETQTSPPIEMCDRDLVDRHCHINPFYCQLLPSPQASVSIESNA